MFSLVDGAVAWLGALRGWYLVATSQLRGKERRAGPEVAASERVSRARSAMQPSCMSASERAMVVREEERTSYRPSDTDTADMLDVASYSEHQSRAGATRKTGRGWLLAGWMPAVAVATGSQAGGGS